MNKITLIVIVAIVFLSQIQCGRCEENSNKPSKEVGQRYSRNSHMEIVRRRLTNVWNLVSKQFSNPNPDSFIGRCIGAAKGLKVAMPLIIFKLGVIVTIVSFLTIFSLKSIGLLLTILFFNITGAFSKLAFLFKNDNVSKQHHHNAPPQTVHFHLHNKPGEAGYGLQHHMEHGGWTEHHHSAPSGYGGWSEKNFGEQSSSSSAEIDRMELQNLYKRLGIMRTSDGRVVPLNYELQQRKK